MNARVLTLVSKTDPTFRTNPRHSGLEPESITMSEVKTKNLTPLVVINTILLVIIVMLYIGMTKEISRVTSENIAQNVVLCGYIEDLQMQTGIDTKRSPNCQGDIKTFSK
jgi:hypothetical protein